MQNRSAREFYSWVPRPLPGPGVMNYAFEHEDLPPFSPIGPTFVVRQPLMVMQHPQVYVTSQAVPLAGFGGLVHGQIFGQALLDPANSTM